MDDMCTDNRFEVIEKYKQKLIECTNIETAQDEMAVLDNILFRFWQMGWLPATQPTIYGYNIEHLELIARALQKEDLPPERVAEALTDIGRIVAIVKDEFEETLRKAVVNYGLSKRYWSSNDCINGGGKAGA